MKLFLVLLAITLVAQISSGAPVPRSRHEADVIPLFKEVLPQMRSKVEAVAKEIPDTNAYAKYKKAFVELLEIFDVTGDFVCYENIMGIFAKTVEMGRYGDNDESPEAAKIRELIDKHNDDEYVAKLTNLRKLLKGPNNVGKMKHCENH